MSKAQRLLAYSLLSIITSKPLESASPTGVDEEDEDDDSGRSKGHMNDEGAWCWREGCDGLSLSAHYILDGLPASWLTVLLNQTA